MRPGMRGMGHLITCGMRMRVPPEGKLAVLALPVQRDLGILAVLEVDRDEQPVAALGPEDGGLERHGGLAGLVCWSG